MEEIATGIREKMARISKTKNKQWPPRSNERLINLQLVQTEGKDGFGDVSHKNEKKKKRTPISYTDIFKSEKDARVDHVIVEGNAGLGKTTFSTMLNKGWAEKKMFQDIKCVFLLPLRNAKVSSATNLEELIKLFHTSEDFCMSAIKELKNTQGKNVLFIADGWDELDRFNRSEDSFLYNLLIIDEILPLATVLVTSRSSASGSLHQFSFRFIEIKGFDAENIEQYIESEFEKQPEKAVALIEQVNSNSLLQSICSIPLNCALICHLWHTLNQVLPTSMTKLYSLLVLCFVLRNLKKRFSTEYSFVNSIENFDGIIGEDLKKKFWHTCKFAYECLVTDSIVFSQQEVTKYFPEVLIQDSRDEILCFGLLQSAESLLPNGQGMSFHFAHLTIQECLAALHVATQTPASKLKIAKMYAKNDRFEIMWRFVFGLCNKKEVYSKNITSVDDHFLDRFLLLVRKGKLLLCHCAAELNESTFSIKVARKFDGDLSDRGHIDDLLDCTAVFHILRHSSPCCNVTLDLSECGLGDIQLHELADILSSAGSELKVKEIDFDNNKLTSKGMNDLFNRASASLCALETMYVDTNKVITLSISPATKRLTASNNPLGIAGMQSLKRFVKEDMLVNLESLSLENTFNDNFTQIGDDMYAILSSIGEHCPCLHTLNLSKNAFDENGVFKLGKALPILCNNRTRFTLEVNEANLDSKKAVAFSRGVVCSLVNPTLNQLKS